MNLLVLGVVIVVIVVVVVVVADQLRHSRRANHRAGKPNKQRNVDLSIGFILQLEPLHISRPPRSLWLSCYSSSNRSYGISTPCGCLHQLRRYSAVCIHFPAMGMPPMLQVRFDYFLSVS